jgi:hypothetical protein
MTINSILTDIYTCAICQRISFPSVRWNVESPSDSNIPKCNHTYCLSCTRRYFELDKESTERVKRYQCLVCQKLIISRKDLYFVCTSDEDNIVKHLMEINNDTRMCESEDCFFDTNDPNEMKEHIKICSSYVTKCKYQLAGCKHISKREELIEHEKQCLYQIKKCLLCHKNIIYKDIYNHMVKYHYISNSVISHQDFIIDTSEINFSSYLFHSILVCDVKTKIHAPHVFKIFHIM